MALLMGMMRTAAITGRPDQVHAWFADRQGGRWADQMVRDAYPAPRHAPKDPAVAARELRELHDQGVLTDAEFEQLRARMAR
jgi:hypothetical protein